MYLSFVQVCTSMTDNNMVEKMSAMAWRRHDCVTPKWTCWKSSPQNGNAYRTQPLRAGSSGGLTCTGTSPTEGIRTVLQEPWLNGHKKDQSTKRSLAPASASLLTLLPCGLSPKTLSHHDATIMKWCGQKALTRDKRWGCQASKSLKCELLINKLFNKELGILLCHKKKNDWSSSCK